MKERTYISIDLKSFYASVECKDRELDPMDTNLVVADESRTDKTICLAVTPSLKSYGISGRGRLFEVRQRVREANAARQQAAPGHRLTGASCSAAELAADPSLAVDFIIAPPRMAFYMEYSRQVYSVYLKYIAPEDMVVYSIDEVFMDVTDYLHTYGLSPRELARKIILDVLDTTGLTATAGIGTNLFLSKVAMDIVAKHIPADKKGVRIAELTGGCVSGRTVGSSAPHGFLAGGPRDCEEAVNLRDFHYGGYCPLFRAGRRTFVSAVWKKRGAAHRPCLGLGALYCCDHQSLPSGQQQSDLRPGAFLRL